MIGKLQMPASVAATFPRFKAVYIAAALAVLVAVAGGLLVAARSQASASYQTQTVVRQDLTQSVTATGTVNPQDTVTVGTQVSGTISDIYVDYNSKVKKGQILARLDPSQLQAQLDQARAALAQAQAQANASSESANGAQSGITIAQANSAAQAATAQAANAAIASADADVAKAQSAAQVAQQTAARDRGLLAQGYIAQSQYDTDESSAVAAQSALKSAQAAAVQARAQAAASKNQAVAGSATAQQSVSQAAGSADTAQAAAAAVQAAQAQVQSDELNLQRSVIVSPVDGTVIARSVSVGQTVAASLQTPTLFTIAKDLNKMEVDIAVGEPDIGNVRPGDAVSFNVLAYPNETFRGTVAQVRENPTTVNNVVTYTVITRVDNPKNELLPGMTANASISIATAKNALVVPASALSWHPTSGGKRTHRYTSKSATSSASASSPWGQTSGSAGTSVASGNTGVLFVQRNGKAVPTRVKIDLVSGTQAAVTPIKGVLDPGDEVITGNTTAAAAPSSHSQGGGSSPGMGGIGRAMR